MIIYTHLYILWICLSSFKDIIKRKMEQRVCEYFYTHKVNGSGDPNTILEHKVQISKRYTITELKCIKVNVEQDRWLCILHADICLTIRRLRLDKRWKRRKAKSKDNHRRSANLCNLITIPLKTTPSNRNLEKQCKLMTLNAQSVKKKDTLIMDSIIENKVDVCVVTETWLKEQDNIWISNSKFKKNNYIIKVANRNKRQGGGLALICRSHYRVKECSKGINQTFEYAIWQCHPNNISLTVLAIYHPPYLKY